MRANVVFKAVVGLSGGIDSALTFYLACRALGPRTCWGSACPAFSSPGSISDARDVAANLGAEFRLISINEINAAYLETLAPHLPATQSAWRRRTCRARIRGNLLMAISNKYGHLVLSTGNKSELSVGYCTLYGDMAVWR